MTTAHPALAENKKIYDEIEISLEAVSIGTWEGIGGTVWGSDHYAAAFAAGAWGLPVDHHIPRIGEWLLGTESFKEVVRSY
jgi:hypothetical protein